MDLSTFYNQFREETAENVRVLNDGLLALEHQPDHADPVVRSEIDRVFRAMHTVKGSARVLGIEPVARLAHTLEHMLGTVREGQRPLTRALADDLLRGGDAILALAAALIDGQSPPFDVDRLIQSLEAGAAAETAAPAPAAAPEAPATASTMPVPAAAPVVPTVASAAPAAPVAPTPAPARRGARQTVRVRVDRLDRLINLTGELRVGQQIMTTQSAALRDLTTLVQQHEHALLALEEALRQIRFSATQRASIDQTLAGLLEHGLQTRRTLSRQVEQFSEVVNQQSLLVGDLEQEVMAARLLPVSTVFANLPRAVRDLAHATNKEIDLVLSGETTELDRKLIEMLNDPLLHLIRNAVDHAIEPPAERAAAGKPPKGTIAVGAAAVGSEVRITIRDDGRGMQPAKLREIAVRKNLLSAEQAAALSEQDALELIFLPGFSSAQIITDISGRGVGMDVVRTNLTELGGQVLLESTPGQGTQITLVMPLTLVTTRILLVQVGASCFAFPATGCRGTIWAYRDDLRTLEGQTVLEIEGRTVPLLRLADLLHIEAGPAFQQRERTPLVLLGSTQRQVGLLVDGLLDEREAVVKPLGALLEAQRQVSGAVQLGDGSLVLLLNPLALVQAARGMTLANGGVAAGRQRQARLLITDDSFTTRELIKSILQSAGYHVTTAVDGYDALNKLREQTFDLVVSDVEMPRVNGFQLTSRIRQELQLDDLPVIIMTSLASDEHRRQGLEAGAQAYIVKSQFNQDNLLEVIQQLLVN